jgi:hypothetical protein
MVKFIARTRTGGKAPIRTQYSQETVKPARAANQWSNQMVKFIAHLHGRHGGSEAPRARPQAHAPALVQPHVPALQIAQFRPFTPNRAVSPFTPNRAVFAAATAVVPSMTAVNMDSGQKGQWSKGAVVK